MKLHCPDCGVEIAAGDINLQTMAAKCARCNAVFSFAGAVSGEGAGRRAVATSTPAVGRPSRMTVEDWGGSWSVRWRWFNFGYIFLTFFCIAWDSFLIFWYHMALTERNAPWLMIVFPICHVAVGIGLTYTVLTGYVNRTVLAITGGTLSVRHGPLPWPGNRDVDVGRIDHLVCGWSRSTSNNYRGNGSAPTTANLSAVTHDGQTIRLVSGFTDGDEPLFLKQQLERRLNLQPGPATT